MQLSFCVFIWQPCHTLINSNKLSNFFVFAMKTMKKRFYFFLLNFYTFYLLIFFYLTAQTRTCLVLDWVQMMIVNILALDFLPWSIIFNVVFPSLLELFLLRNVLMNYDCIVLNSFSVSNERITCGVFSISFNLIKGWVKRDFLC